MQQHSGASACTHGRGHGICGWLLRPMAAATVDGRDCSAPLEGAAGHSSGLPASTFPLFPGLTTPCGACSAEPAPPACPVQQPSSSIVSEQQAQLHRSASYQKPSPCHILVIWPGAQGTSKCFTCMQAPRALSWRMQRCRASCLEPSVRCCTNALVVLAARPTVPRAWSFSGAAKTANACLQGLAMPQQLLISRFPQHQRQIIP